MPIARASDATPPAALIACSRPASRMVQPISPPPPAPVPLNRAYSLELELFQCEICNIGFAYVVKNFCLNQSVLPSHGVAPAVAAQQNWSPSESLWRFSAAFRRLDVLRHDSRIAAQPQRLDRAASGFARPAATFAGSLAILRRGLGGRRRSSAAGSPVPMICETIRATSMPAPSSLLPGTPPGVFQS